MAEPFLCLVIPSPPEIGELQLCFGVYLMQDKAVKFLYRAVLPSYAAYNVRIGKVHHKP